MSITPYDVVKSVQEVPTMFQQRFSEYLVNFIATGANFAQRNLARLRSHEQQATAEVTATKKFRTPQKLPSVFNPGKDHLFPEISKFEDEKPKPKGP